MSLCNQYDLVRFGRMVNDIRSKQSISLEKLADKSGLSINTIRRLEQGTFSCRFDTLSLLSFYLNTDLVALLTHSKDKLYEEVSIIRYHLDIDLSKRNYGELTSYLNQLQSFYDRITYQENDIYYIQFFNLIDKMILWINAIELSAVQHDYTAAENQLINALKINHPKFDLLNLNNSKLTGIELNMLNSLISNRLEAGNFHEIDTLIDQLKEMLLSSRECHHCVYIRLCFNAATLYFHRTEYGLAIDTIDETITYMKKNNTKTDYATLLVIKASSRFMLGLTKDHSEIIVALDFFIYEDKEHLIDIVLKNLEDSYGLKVNYKLPS